VHKGWEDRAIVSRLRLTTAVTLRDLRLLGAEETDFVLRKP
jgi:hypothetical protein